MECKENRFNLVDEPWIPVAGVGLVSLMRVFDDPDLRALGGNPVQKIALTKLLLAIAQAAYTPQDEEAWEALGAAGLSARVRDYLAAKRDCFWLYGEKPFLQMPGVISAAILAYGAADPSVATGNTTVLTEYQVERDLSDAAKALLAVQLMGFGLGGKKTDNSVVLSPGYAGKSNDKGKPSTSKPGTSVGFMGFLHSFLTGPNLWATTWVNLATQDQLTAYRAFSNGLGPIPWETPPQGEVCAIAKDLQASLMGRLVPYSRFFLMEEKGLRYSEGISHPGYKDGSVDPSVAADFTGKEPKVLWVDPERRPWRFLTALLSFIQAGSKNQFNCVGLRWAVPRLRKTTWDKVGLWSGGLRVSSNAGEQYVSGSDDYVESEVILASSFLNEIWFEQLKLEMGALEDLSKVVYGSCLSYQRALKAEGDKTAAQAGNLFWQLAERQFQNLVDACLDVAKVKKLRKTFADYAQQAYNTYCPQDSARQLDAWAAHRPHLGKYLA